MGSKNKVSSMTAFAQCRSQNELGTLTAEMRAVNSRFFELNLRLPETLRNLEPNIRELLRSALNRGKIEINLRFEPLGDATLEPNKTLVHALLETCQNLSKNASCPVEINMMDILRWPGAMISSTTSQEQLTHSAFALITELMEKFQADREREGAALAKVITTRLDKITEHVEQITPETTQIMQTQREKILDKINQLNIEFDPHRLEQELVFLAQKTDIAEELDRLQTHIHEIRTTLTKGGAVGRRLDFLVQELHREANTLGSKSMAKEITYHAVEIKVLIEQIREQVQNLE